MDFRFDNEEQQILNQASSTFRRWLPPERLLSSGTATDGWAKVAEHGWLHLAPGTDDGDQVPLALVSGIGREAGRVLAGDGFITNAVILARSPEPLPPAFMLTDGRRTRLTGGPIESVPWCFGVEQGLTPIYIDDDGTLYQGAHDQWTLDPQPDLALGVGSVSTGPLEPASTITITPDTAAAARVVHGATLVGLGEQILEDATEHAKQRHQFGTPIGRFQGVKHPLAEASVALEVAWNAVLYASVRLDDTTAAAAALQSKRAADLAVKTATQTFGGLAITWEHHLHLYLKVARTGRHRFGDTVSDAMTLAESLRRTSTKGDRR